MLRIKSLNELRDMDISEGCPKIESLPDTIDPTKYYIYVEGVLSQKWVNVGSILEYIDNLRNTQNNSHNSLNSQVLLANEPNGVIQIPTWDQIIPPSLLGNSCRGCRILLGGESAELIISMLIYQKCHHTEHNREIHR